MKKVLPLAISLAIAGFTTSASAENPMGLEFSADVAFTSNYVFRGISESGEEAAIQGGMYASHESGIYAGIWGASVSGYTGAVMEFDYNLGWSGDVGPVGLDLGVTQYTYPGQSNPDSDTTEFYVGVSKDFGMFSAGLSYAYSDDFYNAGDNDYWMVSAEVPVGDFTISGHYGDTERDDGTDYEDWSLGVSTELGGFGFAVTFTDTDGLAADEDYTAFSISKSL